MKPGWKTSEFWLSLGAQILTVLFASGIVADGTTFEKALVLVAGILGALGYAVVRGGVKKADTAGSALVAKAAGLLTGNKDPS